MNGLSLAETADFALAFWMLHEVPDQAAFLAEVRACLKPSGRLLIAEPRVHVGGAAFERSVEMACLADLLSVVWPAVAMSRAVLCSR
ncbi:MAG: class I SAM-dependent methyltransferase [Anaerolineae bacterium]|nr:class I SAM-dependent methyltransferase [Anaerolineae bacterium]